MPDNKILTKTKDADELGQRMAALVKTGQRSRSYGLLAPVLAQRTPFRLLGRIGQAIGESPLEEVNPFLDQIAETRTEGGWVVIGAALGQQLDRDLSGAFARCRAYITTADVWYAADIFGERVPGPALIADFQTSLDLLASWREDADRWVRRAVGVSVHFWAKRSDGAAEQVGQAEALLAFLEPMFDEWQSDAAKGIGWGLKTLGKHYPELVTDWLARQGGRRHRAVVMRKALTYLSEDQRARLAQDLA